MQKNIFYLPILKFKDGEKRALQKLDRKIKKKVVPLLELVKKERQRKGDDNKINYFPISDDEVLKKDLEYIKDKFSDMDVFIDTKILSDFNRESAIQEIYRQTSLFKSSVYPVVYLSELRNFTECTKSLLFSKGFCLRVCKNEITDLEKLMFESKIKEAIHLLLDFDITDESITSIIPLIKNKTFTNNWKSITLASGSAPRYLTDFTAGKVGVHERSDWKAWNNIVSQLDTSFNLNYGDYATRYPIFENIHNPNTSFSFRYTGDDSWFIFRGFSKKSKHYMGYIQYRAHALNLIENEEFQFSGENFSDGDAYIKSKAKLIDEFTGKPLSKECGSPPTWLQAAINHHISKVVSQLQI